MSWSMFCEKPGQQRADDEGDDRDLEQQPPAVEVGDLAPQRGGGGGGQHVGGDDPRQLVEAAELGGDARQGGADDALVQGGQEHAGHQAAHDHEDLLVGQVAVGVGGHAGFSCGCESGWASDWTRRLSTSRASRVRRVSRSSSDQPSRAVEITCRRASKPWARQALPCSETATRLARPSSGSSVRSSRPLSSSCRACRLTVDASRPEDLGEGGQPHRALVGEQLEDRERGVVDRVAGLALPEPPPERHHQAHQGVLGGLRRRDRLGEHEGRRLHVASIQLFACVMHVFSGGADHVPGASAAGHLQRRGAEVLGWAP